MGMMKMTDLFSISQKSPRRGAANPAKADRVENPARPERPDLFQLKVTPALVTKSTHRGRKHYLSLVVFALLCCKVAFGVGDGPCDNCNGLRYNRFPVRELDGQLRYHPLPWPQRIVPQPRKMVMWCSLCFDRENFLRMQRGAPELRKG